MLIWKHLHMWVGLFRANSREGNDQGVVSREKWFVVHVPRGSAKTYDLWCSWHIPFRHHHPPKKKLWWKKATRRTYSSLILLRIEKDRKVHHHDGIRNGIAEAPTYRWVFDLGTVDYLPTMVLVDWQLVGCWRIIGVCWRVVNERTIHDFDTYLLQSLNVILW